MKNFWKMSICLFALGFCHVAKAQVERNPLSLQSIIDIAGEENLGPLVEALDNLTEFRLNLLLEYRESSRALLLSDLNDKLYREYRLLCAGSQNDEKICLMAWILALKKVNFAFFAKSARLSVKKSISPLHGIAKTRDDFDSESWWEAKSEAETTQWNAQNDSLKIASRAFGAFNDSPWLGAYSSVTAKLWEMKTMGHNIPQKITGSFSKRSSLNPEKIVAETYEISQMFWLKWLMKEEARIFRSDAFMAAYAYLENTENQDLIDIFTTIKERTWGRPDLQLNPFMIALREHFESIFEN